MTDPYLIEGPALISFSGGRTSAYLLKHVLDVYGGTLPANVLTCFANTGKEMPQTLDFVRDCGQHWNVPIVWLEYDPAGETQVVVHFEIVYSARLIFLAFELLPFRPIHLYNTHGG